LSGSRAQRVPTIHNHLEPVPQLRRLPLQRLSPLPVHLGPLLSVAELQEECVEFGFRS
jgi:hypothetical protein